MRLVSALYEEFHPFYQLANVEDYAVVNKPSDLKKGDILITHGGADISPQFYKKGRSSRGGGDIAGSRRDWLEWDLQVKAKVMGIPIIGICRGAQMLCALEGGHLIQHIDGHSGMHEVFLNDAVASVMTNSIHHQQMVPAGEYELVGWTLPKSKGYWDVDSDGKDHVLPQPPLLKDPEFVYYPAIKGFAVQWHPEMMSEEAPANQFLINFINSKL